MNEHLENELRAALRRQEPSADFAERVLAKTHPAGSSPRPIFRLRWAAAALAACAMLGIGLTEYRERREERQRGLEAKQELMQAMRITGSKLRLAQEKVRHWNE